MESAPVTFTDGSADLPLPLEVGSLTTPLQGLPQLPVFPSMKSGDVLSVDFQDLKGTKGYNIKMESESVFIFSFTLNKKQNCPQNCPG